MEGKVSQLPVVVRKEETLQELHRGNGIMSSEMNSD